MMLTLGASAEILVATGSVNLRWGPGLEHDAVFAVKPGTALQWADYSRYNENIIADDRGVAWYCVDHAGVELWVSEKYIKVCEEAPKRNYDISNAKDYLEIEDYWNKDLITAKDALKLPHYFDAQNEAPNQYFNESLVIWGSERMHFLFVLDTGYKVHGAHVGMDLEAAKELLCGAGLTHIGEDQDFMWDYDVCEAFLYLPEGREAWDYEYIIGLRVEDGVVTRVLGARPWLPRFWWTDRARLW